MSWRRGTGGGVLKRHGSIVIADTCCCGAICCDCAWLQSEYLLGKQVKVTISGGGFSAVCFFESAALTGTSCANWHEIAPGCADTDICTYNLQAMFFVCNGPTVQFETGLANMGCDMTTSVGDPTPQNFAARAKYPVSELCELTKYTARFEFPLAEQLPGGCGCAAGPVVFEVETT